MPKISAYTELVNPDPTVYLVGSVPGTTNKFKAQETVFLAYRQKMAPQFTDLLGNVTLIGTAPYGFSAITGGTVAQIASIANHPGIFNITSAAAANTGAVFSLSSSILLGGGEVAEFIIRLNSTTNLQLYAGFVDADTPTAPTDGAWINISGATLTGKTANNTATSTTGTSYAVSTATWYRFKVVLNSDVTLVTFYVYDASGTVLWTDTLSTNIPTAAGRETDMRISVIKTAITATSMADIDWISFWSSDVQTR